LIASIYFSLGRLLAYLFLGLIVGYVGGYFLNPFASASVIIPLGIILILYGFLISFGSKLRFASIICCGFSKIKSTFLLGMMLGLRPCIPLIAALTYSATLSTVFDSFVFMSSFWLGSTAYIPILGILAGTLTHFAILRSNVDRIRRISGIALIVVGLIFVNQGIAYLFSIQIP
jgi:sulfite exporter TauE/SafE